ncbi:MAG: GNAT family N-acetyltransferase [Acidobacteriaceae bacterium]|nr:GNAT family N-acetyltransferase [Acidobacteriaceae bacterium]
MEQSWREFIRAKARAAKNGEIRAGRGIEAAWANCLLIVNNGTFLTTPVINGADLEERCAEARHDAALQALPWFFFVYEPLLAPALLSEADQIFANAGYHRAAAMVPMVTRLSSLAAPTRILPANVRRISTRAEKIAALELNCIAYNMPFEWAQSAIDSDVYFADPSCEFGYLVYDNSTPVATGGVLILDDSMYVEAMATHPAHRGKGYAEAIIRTGLDEASKASGLDHTSLDASDAGRPLYQRMGYRHDGSGWRYYVPV